MLDRKPDDRLSKTTAEFLILTYFYLISFISSLFDFCKCNGGNLFIYLVARKLSNLEKPHELQWYGNSKFLGRE